MRGLWREMRRIVKSPPYSEIRHHAAIGAAIAFALASLDYARAELFPHLFGLRTIWVISALVCVGGFAYLLAFIAITVLELWLRTPVYLDDVGIVDGEWVYAMRDADGIDFSMGSIVHIESSGLGFKLKGWSYSRKKPGFGKNKAELEQIGDFTAYGISWTEGRIYFFYSGREGEVEDSGVGYYTFRERNSIFTLDGRFTGKLGRNLKTTTRIVKGCRVQTRDEQEKLDAESATSLLLANLDAQLDLCSENQDLRFSFEQARVVDGHWVSAIFEKTADTWKVIEGSVLIIKSSSESKRFDLEGWTYVWAVLKPLPDLKQIDPPFNFKGDGRPLEESDGFYYQYTGFAEDRTSGVGYYTFVRDDSDNLSFIGTFVRRLGEPVRIVYGKKIKETEWSNRVAVLRDHLNHCDGHPPHAIAALQRTAV